MSSNCFNKNTPNFDELSIEFWKRELVNDLFLTLQNIVSGTATLSKEILSGNIKCLQWKVELPSNCPRVILQYDLNCDENETVLMIPVKDYQIMEENSGPVDDGNVCYDNIAASVEMENVFSPVRKLKLYIPELLSILNENELKNKNVEKNQIASPVETHINSSSTSESEKNVNDIAETIEQNRYRDDVIQNKRAEEIATNKSIKRKKPNTYSCIYSEKLFKRKSLKQRHERIHTSESSSKRGQPVSCSSNLLEQKIFIRKKSIRCDKRFTDSRTEIHHTRIHTGKKPFKSEECDKSFTRAAHLKDQERIHTGEKPYKCEKCDKSFSHSNYLRVHERIHTGEKPYKCEKCDKCFTQANSLTCHRRIHTGEKPFACDVCGKSFNRSFTLNRHKKLHNGENALIVKRN